MTHDRIGPRVQQACPERSRMGCTPYKVISALIGVNRRFQIRVCSRSAGFVVLGALRGSDNKKNREISLTFFADSFIILFVILSVSEESLFPLPRPFALLRVTGHLVVDGITDAMSGR
jgi:hypothetical protein